MSQQQPERHAERTLSGRVALVTGSTSGIGRGIALALADAGASVMLNGFGDAAQIEALRTQLERTSGAKAAYASSDLASAQGVGELLKQVRGELGEVDILVCNAGIQFVSPIEQFPPERWDAILALNLSSAFHAIRLALPAMRERGWGRIVNVASVHGLVASPFKSAYVAAKHGLIGLTRAVALEAAQSGVTVNAICPGYVLTPLVEKQIPAQAAARGISEEVAVRDVILDAQPTKRFIDVSEVAALAVYLCSEAARSITGAALTVDGGWSAR